jgi:hypothetical protein
MSIKQIITIAIIFISVYAHAQDHSSSTNHNHQLDHSNNEIGIANSIVYFVNAKETAYGLHLHYIHYFHQTKFGAGLGYERVFDEHKHNTFGVIGTYSPVNSLTLSFSPGITFEDEHSDELKFACHFEVTYEFEIGDFHIGPVAGIASDPEDYHLGIGIHLGYGF